MIDYDILDLGNEFQMECLWFCFSRVLQSDLDKVKEHWNSHRVTESPYSRVHGVPDIMYFLPEYHGHEECLVDVSEQQIDEIEEHCQMVELNENIYHEYFIYVLETEGLDYPRNEREALTLYQRLTELQNV